MMTVGTKGGEKVEVFNRAPNGQENLVDEMEVIRRGDQDMLFKETGPDQRHYIPLSSTSEVQVRPDGKVRIIV